MKLPSIKADADPASPAGPSLVEEPSGTGRTSLPRSPIAYLGALWRGEVPLSQAIWRDMACVGTALNIVAMGGAFLAVALGASTLTGIAIHLLPVPYNIFLVASVWRSAEREPADRAWAARIGSVAWLLVAFVI